MPGRCRRTDCQTPPGFATATPYRGSWVLGLWFFVSLDPRLSTRNPLPSATSTPRLRGSGTIHRMTVLAVSDISKSFEEIQALQGVSLQLHRGEVHALLGENGAGKSTLLGILSGLIQPDAGTITIDGFPHRLSSPAEALKTVIATVFQHFTLVPPLSVAENLRLGLSRAAWASDADLNRRLASLGLALPLEAPVAAIPVGQRQLVEIAKALLRKPRMLLLDEPTSVLAGAEIDHLLALIQSIAGQGTAIILVTHKLNEALNVADRITVLRRGKVTGEINLRASSGHRGPEPHHRGPEPHHRGPEPHRRPSLDDRLIAMMFGSREVLPTVRRGEARWGATPPSIPHHVPTGEARVVARLSGVRARDDRGGQALDRLSLEVTAGEVLGVAGVEGNGQDALAEIFSGERPVDSGALEINGRPMTNAGTRALIDAGIGVTTGERIAVGCVPGTSLATNLALKRIASPPFAEGIRLHRFEIRQFARELIQRFDIQPGDPDQPITQLSGGNIQRALLARDLAFRPDLLVCNQPTAGLDLFTAEQMLARIHDAASEGTAVILISSDLDELLRHCDRIAVLYRGSVAGTLAQAEFDADRIAHLMVTGQEAAA
jgi:ABC-type uncharacterized transport system ATPase subunit